MAKRFDDALGINWGGASNPSGIARTLVEAIDEARGAGKRAREDAAVQLILHHLCQLAGIPTMEADPPGFTYKVAVDACCAEASDDTLARMKLNRPIPGAPGSSFWNAEMRAEHLAAHAAD